MKDFEKKMLEEARKQTALLEEILVAVKPEAVRLIGGVIKGDENGSKKPVDPAIAQFMEETYDFTGNYEDWVKRSDIYRAYDAWPAEDKVTRHELGRQLNRLLRRSVSIRDDHGVYRANRGLRMR